MRAIRQNTSDWAVKELRSLGAGFSWKPWVQSQVNLCEIHGEWNGTGTDLYTIFSTFHSESSFHHCSIPPCPGMCDSPNQAAHYHTLGLHVFVSSLTRHFTAYRVRKTEPSSWDMEVPKRWRITVVGRTNITECFCLVTLQYTNNW